MNSFTDYDIIFNMLSCLDLFIYRIGANPSKYSFNSYLASEIYVVNIYEICFDTSSIS